MFWHSEYSFFWLQDEYLNNLSNIRKDNYHRNIVPLTHNKSVELEKVA